MSVVPSSGLSASRARTGTLTTTVTMLSEPTDLTVDFLHVVFGHLPLPQYAHTLSACSLVCKTWLPVARDCLFAYLHVGLAQPEDGVMLAEQSSELVEWNGLIKPKYADPLLARQLSISARGVHAITHAILSRTLPACPRVRHLRIGRARLSIPSSVSEIPVVSYALETIGLDNVHALPQDLINLLSLFPGTRAITIEDCNVMYEDADGTSCISSPSTISRVEPTSLKVLYSDTKGGVLFDFFRRTRMIHALRTFAFSLHHGSSLDADLGTGLSEFIGQLANLEVLLWDDASWDIDMAMFLAKFHPEDEQEIATIEHKIEDFQTQVASIFPRLLKLHTFSMSPPSPNLPERTCAAFLELLPISIRRVEVHISSYASWTFELFATALTRFQDLQSFAIVMLEKEFTGYDTRVDGLKATLSELSSQGKLEIVAGQDRITV